MSWAYITLTVGSYRLVMPLPLINPPLLNSANPWCSSKEQLQELYDCPHTGAITTRTSLLQGFPHDSQVHQHTFFDPHSHAAAPQPPPDGDAPASSSSSLNTLGYSPIPLDDYLIYIRDIISSSPGPRKPFVVSVTGSPDDVKECYSRIKAAHASMPPGTQLCMEVNLSCPNIPGKPPPAYSGPALAEYLDLLANERSVAVPIGIKTPPYTYHDQFATLINTLSAASAASPDSPSPIDFLTATNTLGSCVVLGEEGQPALSSASGQGIGGLAGASLHPLALGNVKTLRDMLDAVPALQSIDVIGVGGVGDSAGFKRMQSVGAKWVGVGTALGREGVPVFSRVASIA